VRQSSSWAQQGFCRGCGGVRDTERVRCTLCVAREKALRDARDRSIPLPIPVEVAERFWKYVGDRPEDPNACWDWIGALDYKGYGQISVAGRQRRTHRIAYMMAYGAIPDGLSVCHKCDRRCCVRASHYFLGTNADNTADMIAKGRNRIPDGTLTSGEDNWNHRLTDEIVIDIRRRIRSGEKGVDLARELGVSRATISEAKNGRLWDHVNHIEPPLEPHNRYGRPPDPPKDDLVGRTFGSYNVVEYIAGSRPASYMCRCVCGRVRKVVACNLKNGNSKSCGCVRKPRGKNKTAVVTTVEPTIVEVETVRIANRRPSPASMRFRFIRERMNRSE